MEQKGYWALFWQTGLPAAWLMSRVAGADCVAALASPEDSGGSV